MGILSIQSHVAYGYVGNRSAAFPLELLGHDVWMVNTVQFSNHTGYGSWKGEAFGAEHVDAVVEGIAERGVLASCEAVLTGYLGFPALGDSVLRAVAAVKAANPRALWCCDPVMGDSEPGFYVRSGIPEQIRERFLPVADIVTPNQFEAEALSGLAIRDDESALAACAAIRKAGPGLVLVTSYKPAARKPGSICMLLSTREGAWRVETPELGFPTQPNGTGDLVSALFLAHWLRSRDPVEALELVTDSVFSVLERTKRDGTRELRLVQSKDALERPGRRFGAVPLGA